MIRRGMLAAIAFALMVFMAGGAQAKGLVISEWGISGYYQFGANLAPRDLRGAGVMAHLAMPLLVSDGAEIQLRLEGMLGGYWDFESATEVALVPALRALVRAGSFAPFVEGGIGGSYTTFEKHDLGSDLNFLLFVGLGVRWEMSPNFAVELGYRYRHLSNAYLGDSNQGLNTHLFQVGLVFPF